MTYFSEAITFVKKFERLSKVRSLHNEILILHLLRERGPLPSLRIMQETGRSISGHNADMKRLLSLGLITQFESEADRRQRIFGLSDTACSLITEANESAEGWPQEEPGAEPDLGRQPLAARAG